MRGGCAVVAAGDGDGDEHGDGDGDGDDRGVVKMWSCADHVPATVDADADANADADREDAEYDA